MLCTCAHAPNPRSGKYVYIHSSCHLEALLNKRVRMLGWLDARDRAWISFFLKMPFRKHEDYAQGAKLNMPDLLPPCD